MRNTRFIVVAFLIGCGMSVTAPRIVAAQGPAQDAFADEKRQIQQLEDEGQVAIAKRDWRTAIGLLERMLAIEEKVYGLEHLELSGTLYNLGYLHSELGDHRKALPLYQRSLAIREKALGPEHPLVMDALENVAMVHFILGNYATAAPLMQRILAAREKSLGADHPRVAEILWFLADIFSKTGEPLKGMPLAQRGLSIREKAFGPEHAAVADSLSVMALLYQGLGEFAKALPYAERALAIREKVLGPEHPSVAAGLNGLALLYVAMGEPAKALPLQQRSLAIREKAFGHEHPLVATSLNNLAGLYQTMGEYARALPLYQRSLAIWEKALGPEHPSAATGLGNLAELYRAMGEHAKALPLYQRSLAIREKALGPEHPSVATSLNNLGALYWTMGEYAKALPLYQRSFAILEKALGPEHPSVATSLNNLAGLYQDLGEHAKALPLNQQSLVIFEKALGPEHPSVATSLNNLALLYVAMGEPAKAVPLSYRALRIASQEIAPETLWRVQDTLRFLLAREGKGDLAVFFGKQAVNTIQELRGRLTGIDRELQKSFLSNKEGAYRGLAELMIEQGRLPEAQQVLAMLKEEEFFDFIRRDAKSDPRTTQTALTEQEEAWRKRYGEVSGRLAALGTEAEELRKKARLGLSDAEQTRRAAVEADLRIARLAFDRFLGALMKEVESAGAARAREVGERGLANLRALQGTLGSLGPGVVALHYLMGEEKLRVILTTPSVQIAREADIGTKDLNRKIEQFRRVLQNPKSNPLPMAQELYQLLIAPVAEDLRQAKAQTLMISLDGALRYIPLAALHDGKSYVVEQYRLAIFTEAAKDKLKDIPQTSWRLAGLGLTLQVEGFSALPAVRQELEGIIRTGTRGVLPGEAHFDQAFTAVRLRDALDKGYPVLHLASHFVFQPGTESNSFLLLGDGNRLTLREIKENDYDFRNVDLITLSACDTAMGGGRDASGAEIEGFGALAQRQGARGVIATLWPVADESTGLLMQSFYRLREAEKLTKAEALRQAQQLLIRGRAAGGTDAQRGAGRADAGAAGAPASTYAHPYFWAPFILMGNWL